MAAKLLGILWGAFLFFVSCYLSLWLVAYSVFQDFDYSQLLKYIAYAWHGGFEIPSFIQMFSLSVSCILTPVFVFVLLLDQRRDVPPGAPPT